MKSDLRIVIDLILGLALMEAIVKPVSVRLTQELLKYVDEHVLWIPDWLYKDLMKDKPEDS